MLTFISGMSADERDAAKRAQRAAGVLTPVEAAAHLGTTENTLRWQRCKGKGPPHHKAGGRFYYLRDELDAYRAEKERGRAGTTRRDP